QRAGGEDEPTDDPLGPEALLLVATRLVVGVQSVLAVDPADGPAAFGDRVIDVLHLPGLARPRRRRIPDDRRQPRLVEVQLYEVKLGEDRQETLVDARRVGHGGELLVDLVGPVLELTVLKLGRRGGRVALAAVLAVLGHVVAGEFRQRLAEDARL